MVARLANESPHAPVSADRCLAEVSSSGDFDGEMVLTRMAELSCRFGAGSPASSRVSVKRLYMNPKIN